MQKKQLLKGGPAELRVENFVMQLRWDPCTVSSSKRREGSAICNNPNYLTLKDQALGGGLTVSFWPGLLIIWALGQNFSGTRKHSQTVLGWSIRNNTTQGLIESKESKDIYFSKA